MELERIGLRKCSLPFDWLITGDFRTVLELMENGFKGFLDRENFYQESAIHPAYYYNRYCHAHFYHDFVSWKSFDSQFDALVAKYQKRIRRFYQMIGNPTVFIRYCANEEEMSFIRSNRDKITSLLKSFHPDNTILYVTNVSGASDESTFYVKKDQGDDVTRQFLNELPELGRYLTEISGLTDEEVRKNIAFYRSKQRKKVWRKVVSRVDGMIHPKPYIHSKQYEQIAKEKE